MRHFSGEFEGIRLLMADELTEIAGGEGEDTDTVPPTEVEEVIVNGVLLPHQYYYSPPIISGGGGYGAGGDGAGPEDDYPDAADTPCVETAFASSPISVDRVNNAARAAADAIVAMGNHTTREWGAFIYSYGGQVLFTPPFTNSSGTSVTFNSGVLPTGAHVLGIIHNHPYHSGDPDQRLPSSADWNVYNTFAGNSVNGKTFDSNMLNYIFTNQDGSVRPYDNTDKTQNTATCAL